MGVKSWGGTDKGRVREHNDNAFFHSSRRGVFLVANGVGGDRRAGKASAILLGLAQQWADRFHEVTGPQAPPPTRAAILNAVSGLFRDASTAIYEQAMTDPRQAGMCTTGALVCVYGKSAAVGHVGQNRVFLVREGRAEQVTNEHTVAHALVERGILAPGEIASSRYRNVLARTVGSLPAVEVETLWLDLSPGDALILCSKGLTDHLEGEDLERLVADGKETFVERALALANERGGTDNATAVLVDITAEEAAGSPRVVLDSAARVALLRRQPLFEHLSERELLRVLRVVYETRHEAGAIVVREGTPGDELFVVAEGRLQIEQDGVELTTLGPGRQLGDVSFIEGVPRSASARALTPCTLLSIKRDDFLRSLANEDPRLAGKLLWGLCQHLSRRLRELSADLVASRRAHHAGEPDEGSAPSQSGGA